MWASLCESTLSVFRPYKKGKVCNIFQWFYLWKKVTAASNFCKGGRAEMRECEVVALSPLGQCALKKYQKTDFPVKVDFYEWAILKQIPSYCSHSFSHHYSYRVGRIPWRRERLPTPVLWPGESHGLYSPWGHKELDTTEQLLPIMGYGILFFCAVQ